MKKAIVLFCTMGLIVFLNVTAFASGTNVTGHDNTNLIYTDKPADSVPKTPLYEVFIKSLVKEAVPGNEAAWIRNELMESGLNVKVEVSSQSVSPTEELALGKAIYDIYILSSFAKNCDMNNVSIIKSKLEELGIALEIRKQSPTSVEAMPNIEEKTNYDLVLVSAGEKKTQIICIIMEAMKLGQKEARILVDNAPSVLISGTPGDEKVEILMRKLKKHGATVELR